MQSYCLAMRGDRHRRAEELKGFSKKRGATLAEDLDILLGDLCVRWGFCNHLSGAELTKAQPLTADAFARAVLAAEGDPEPELELAWSRKFRRLFVERYGEAITPTDYVPK